MAKPGQFKYDQEMRTNVSVRMTQAQANSLTAMAHAMSLTVADTLRFAFDELTSDIPEPRLFTRKVRIQFK